MIWRLVCDVSCTIRSGGFNCDTLYDINLGATHTTIPSTRGVEIPISTDSIQRCVVVFKTVLVPTSDLKSEFLCQSSYIAQNLQAPLKTSYAWDISHALVTTYHPYCHSPSALTEYLKQKLHLQRAKRLGRSLPAQVEPDVQPERNTGGAACDVDAGGGGGLLAGTDADALGGLGSFFFVANTSNMSYSSVVYMLSSASPSESAFSAMYAPVAIAGSGRISKL